MRRFASATVFGVLLLVLAFQNCTSGQSSTSSSNSGNGQGYDGKTFVHLNQNGLCADGAAVDSSIVFRGGVAYLNRDNCADIPLSAQVSVQSDIKIITPYVLTYKERFYFAFLSLASRPDSNSAGEMLVSGLGYRLNGAAYDGVSDFVGKYDGTGRVSWLIGHPWFSTAKSARFMDDGSAAVLVTATATGPAGFDGAWLARLDPKAKTLWSKSLTMVPPLSTNAVEFWVNQAVPSGSGGLMAVGNVRYADFTTKVILLNLSSSGQLTASQTFSTTEPSSGGFVLGPQGDIFFSGNIGARPIVAKLSPQGQILWSRIFSNLDRAQLIPSSSGQLLIAGSFNSPVPGAPSFSLPSHRFIIMASDGSVLSTHRWLPDHTTTPLPGFMSSGTGGYIAQVQAQGHNAAYVAFDGGFNKLWALNYPLPVPDDLSLFGGPANVVDTILAQDGTFVQRLSVNSAVPISNQSSNTIQTSVLMRIPLGPNCAGCTPLANNPAVSAAPNPTVTTGPTLLDAPGVVAGDVAAPAFIDLVPFFIK